MTIQPNHFSVHRLPMTETGNRSLSLLATEFKLRLSDGIGALSQLTFDPLLTELIGTICKTMGCHNPIHPHERNQFSNLYLQDANFRERMSKLETDLTERSEEEAKFLQELLGTIRQSHEVSTHVLDTHTGYYHKEQLVGRVTDYLLHIKGWFRQAPIHKLARPEDEGFLTGYYLHAKRLLSTLVDSK